MNPAEDFVLSVKFSSAMKQIKISQGYCVDSTTLIIPGPGRNVTRFDSASVSESANYRNCYSFLRSLHTGASPPLPTQVLIKAGGGMRSQAVAPVWPR